jgi:hypothetical protein
MPEPIPRSSPLAHRVRYGYLTYLAVNSLAVVGVGAISQSAWGGRVRSTPQLRFLRAHLAVASIISAMLCRESTTNWLATAAFSILWQTSSTVPSASWLTVLHALVLEIARMIYSDERQVICRKSF